MKLWTMLLFPLFWASQHPDPLIIGHRGAKGHVAENTLPSIEKALALGVNAIEIDVFKCATGELVVFHDATLDQLTDSTGDIMAYSLEALKKVKVLGEYQIPTLNEVLDLVAGQVILNIELKGPDTAEATHTLLKSYYETSDWTPETILISSFDWDELRQYRKLDATAALAILVEFDPMTALPIAEELNAIAINPDHNTLSLAIVERFHKSGYKVYPWTVNTPSAIKKMKAFGVDGIISDYPERIQN